MKSISISNKNVISLILIAGFPFRTMEITKACGKLNMSFQSAELIETK